MQWQRMLIIIDTLEVLRTSYNDLVDEVGGLGGLRTSQKGSLVDAVNSID